MTTDLKFGRRAPKNAPALKLADILSGTVPAHPPTADHLDISGWDMLGNDQYGDCVAVTWANYRRLMSRLAGAEKYPDLNAVIEFYKTQNPNFPTDDNGMDIQTALEHLVKNGGPDGTKAVAFAKVDHTNPEEVKAAIAIFGAVWTGVYVQAAQMDQFRNGQPWDYVAGSQDDGGHSIITGGYDSDGQGGDERFVTWAQETSFTDAFWSHQVEEAWVVIWPENWGTSQFTEGISPEALVTAFHELTGGTVQPPVQPTPTPPQPQPSPTPNPASPDTALAAAAHTWLEHHHIGINGVFARHVTMWLEDKGL